MPESEEMKAIKAQIEETKGKLLTLGDEIVTAVKSKEDAPFNESLPVPPRKSSSIKVQRKLNGHFGKVYCVQWMTAEGHTNKLISNAQDGQLVTWNAVSGLKMEIKSLKSAFGMMCATTPDGSTLVSGGLDNTISVYAAGGNPDKPLELIEHEGYISYGRFNSAGKLLTCSGDKTSILWDLTAGKMEMQFLGHKSNVSSLEMCPGSPSEFCTGSADGTAKIFDLKAGPGYVMSFLYPPNSSGQKDVNKAAWCPDGNGVLCVGEDGRCRLYDKRCGGQISFCEKTTTSAGQTCSFSASGRLIFAGYESGAMNVYETNQSGGPTFSQLAKLHESNVQDSELSPCGCALATASWDTTAKIVA